MDFSKDYDSLNALKIALLSLANLNDLLAERQQAHYQRRETLNEWVVLGRFWLDSCGNTWKYTDESIPAVTFPNLPPILTQKDFWEFVTKNSPKEYIGPTARMGDDIPPAKLFCPECGSGWKIENCHDTVVVHENRVINLAEDVGNPLSFVQAKWETIDHSVWRLQSERSIRNDRYVDHTIIDTVAGRKYQWQVNEKGWITPGDKYVIQPGDEAMVNIWTYRHHRCHRTNQARAERKYFLDIFTEAGYHDIALVETENQYCGCDSCAPWYRVCADKHDFLIGWRKRVINIEMDNPRINFAKLFDSEETTKGSQSIHAWGRKKCIEYLHTIKNTLD